MLCLISQEFEEKFKVFKRDVDNGTFKYFQKLAKTRAWSWNSWLARHSEARTTV